MLRIVATTATLTCHRPCHRILCFTSIHCHNSSLRNVPLGKGVLLNKIDENSLIALDKPCNVLSHPNSGGTASSHALINSPYCDNKEAYSISIADPVHNVTSVEAVAKCSGANSVNGDCGRDRKLYLLNRLDSATSGLLLLTKNQAVAESVRSLFSARQVDKCYVALVFGHPTCGPSGSRSRGGGGVVWRSSVYTRRSKEGELRLAKASQKVAAGTGAGPSRTSSNNSNDIKVAITQMKVLKRLHLRLPVLSGAAGTAGTSVVRIPVSVVELHPVTGYTHQLRYQCAEHGMPIVGDKTYGNFAMNKKLLQLAKACQLQPQWSIGAEPGGEGIETSPSASATNGSGSGGCATASATATTSVTTTDGIDAGTVKGVSTGDASDGQWLLQSIRRENQLRLFLHCHKVSLTYSCPRPANNDKSSGPGNNHGANNHHQQQRHHFAAVSRTLGDMLPPVILADKLVAASLSKTTVVTDAPCEVIKNSSGIRSNFVELKRRKPTNR